MDAPIRFLDTDKIAPDTYVIRQLMGEGVAPVAVHLNSMVITGREPVIVDTGASLTRDGWIERAFELVEPADVRWVYLSHDDADHIGALLQVLEMCPKATLVTNWFSVERMSADHLLPLDRMRWVNDGETFSVDGRDLVAVVPPTYDSPTTRGLFDPATGVYWASDSFGMPVTHEVGDVDELDPEFLRGGFVQFQQMLSPWVQWLDAGRFNAHLDRVAALGAKTVASAHGVTLRDGQVDLAFDLLRQLPGSGPAALPGQADLEGILAAMAA